MNDDDYKVLTLVLLAANLVALFLTAGLLLDEIQRRPRVIRIYDGDKKDDTFRKAEA